jgi:hypothetical protein
MGNEGLIVAALFLLFMACLAYFGTRDDKKDKK